MKLNVTRPQIWVAGLQDRPGALAEKLVALSAAGVDLEFVLARRQPDKPGTGVVFLSPIRGARQSAAARKQGVRKSKSLHAVRVDGTDRPGLGAALTQALADAGINLRGLSAAVVGRRFVVHAAFDKPTDAAKAVRIIKNM
jgi:predicted amino acid-binding ACT domain protein